MKYTVHADKRTSCAYLVYDGDGNFLHDYADDGLATFIQDAINNHEANEARLASYSAELSAESAKVKELEAQTAHWKANHDEAIRKLRIFTDRTDLPVDRTRAYEYVNELEVENDGLCKNIANAVEEIEKKAKKIAELEAQVAAMREKLIQNQ
jgi:uncharacterized protein YhaN